MLYGEVFKDGLILEYHIMKMYAEFLDWRWQGANSCACMQRNISRNIYCAKNSYPHKTEAQPIKKLCLFSYAIAHSPELKAVKLPNSAGNGFHGRI